VFSNPIRIALILGCIGFGIYRVVYGDRIGLLLIFAGILYTYGYFRYSSVWLAFRAVRKGDLDRAARLLSQTRNPSSLSSQQRAYFELASGIVAANRGEEEAAERHFRAALHHKLRTENDRCIAEVCLAELLARRGNFDEARELVTQARTRHHKPELAECIDRIATSVGPSA
jgi:ATP/maltotriose-dependent transcriptional regulator MalT